VVHRACLEAVQPQGRVQSSTPCIPRDERSRESISLGAPEALGVDWLSGTCRRPQTRRRRCKHVLLTKRSRGRVVGLHCKSRECWEQRSIGTWRGHWWMQERRGERTSSICRYPRSSDVSPLQPLRPFLPRLSERGLRGVHFKYTARWEQCFSTASLNAGNVPLLWDRVSRRRPTFFDLVGMLLISSLPLELAV
jgi:hypothetical protein